jgi:hypothetical protein
MGLPQVWLVPLVVNSSSGQTKTETGSNQQLGSGTRFGPPEKLVKPKQNQ